MTSPKVTELPRVLHPVTRDPFLAGASFAVAVLPPAKPAPPVPAGDPEQEITDLDQAS